MEKANPKFPATRYQGSKLKYVDWIWDCVKDLQFETVLDAFGGTGTVSYKFKQHDKTVTYNDILKFNTKIGKALIRNNNVTLDDQTIDFLLTRHPEYHYPDFIEKTFSDTYYTDEENRWLDMVIINIHQLEDQYKEALAYFALFQSCIIKRPYNLFHRKNLYIRTQEVERTFGNKTSWDTPFDIHFRKFAAEANNAVFSNYKNNIVLNQNVFDIKNNYDLVYIDSPYVPQSGTGLDYTDLYHFLEGIMYYDTWEEMIDQKSKHKKLKSKPSAWTKAKVIEDSFERLIKQFSDSILVISYRSDGIPSIERIKEILEENGKTVEIFESNSMKYVLSKKVSSEVLIVAK